MQTKKMSLANIQGKFSRVEMKNIMAGSGSNGGSSCTTNCWNLWSCSYNGRYWTSAVCTTSSGSGYDPGICSFTNTHCN